MSTRHTHGTLAVSVDLEHDQVQVGIAEQRALDSVASELMELFTRQAIPATWAVIDPVLSTSRSRVELARGKHELALLGDATWVGREAGRSRFSRELLRRVSEARSAGLVIRTLALRTEMPVEHCDLAIKEGIVAARQPLESPKRGQLKPQVLRFGLWGFPISLALPGTSRWLPGGGGLRAARYEIDRAIAERGLAHLSISATQLAQRGASAMRIVERIVEHAAQRREHHLLHIATLGSIAAHLAQEHCSQPARSILRPAA